MVTTSDVPIRVGGSKKRVSWGATVTDRLTAKIDRLQHENRSLRRRVAIELVCGVVVVALGLVLVAWLGLQSGCSDGATRPDGPAVATQQNPQPAAPMHPKGGAPSVPVPTPGTESPAVAEGAVRFGDVEVAVERAVITNMVLTEFFGVPGVDPDFALLIHIRVTNLSRTDTVTYTTPRPGWNTRLERNIAVAVDDVGRRYRGIDYRKVPEGGLVAARIEPGDAIADVLIFEAPGHDVRYLDLIMPGASVGLRQTLNIRVPWETVEHVATWPARESPAPSVPDDASRPEPAAPSVPNDATTPEPAAPPEDEDLAVVPTHPADLHEAGRAYLFGEGVRKDEAKGHQWLLMAAELGHSAAQSTVGRNFETGRGTQPNPAEAFRWYTEAANQKYPEGQWNLGRAYREGIGVGPDPSEALRWFRKAGKQHHTQAMWDVVEMLKSGDRVKPDLRQATWWLKELMKLGDREAHIELVSLDPSAYVGVAKALKFRKTDLVNEPGSVVKMWGQLRDHTSQDRPDPRRADPSRSCTWSLDLPLGRSVRVDMSRITERLREGIFVNLCGIVGADQTIDAIVCEIPEPTVEVEITRVRAPEGVPGGQWTRYIVEGVVRNTGKQRILSCNASVRVHVRAATSLLVPIPSKRLMPGAKYEFAVECRMVNPRTVSPPVGEVTFEDPEW